MEKTKRLDANQIILMITVNFDTLIRRHKYHYEQNGRPN